MIGSTVSHYKILEKLGGGGMGVVYKAEDTKLHRTIALKFLPPELTRDEEAKKRFIHEAQAASSLQHNNICTIHDVDETPDGQIFMCMDCYEGQTLEKYINDLGPLDSFNHEHESNQEDQVDKGLLLKSKLPINEVINIIRQMAEGLREAHSNGIIHRDIKSANIFITKDKTVKILDFGLAKLKQETLSESSVPEGTIEYMSPEQAKGEQIDQRTDIWSLGVILYEMLTGTKPFQADYPAALIYSILNYDYEPISRIGSNVPQEIISLCDACLKKDKNLRIQSADDIITEIKNYENNWLVSPINKYKSLKKSIFIGSAVSLILIATALFTYNKFILDKAPVDQKIRIGILPFQNFVTDNSTTDWPILIQSLFTSELGRLQNLSVIDFLSINGLIESSFGRSPPKRNPKFYDVLKKIESSFLVDGTLLQTKDGTKINANVVNPSTGQVKFSSVATIKDSEELTNAIKKLSTAIINFLEVEELKSMEGSEITSWISGNSENLEAIKAFLQACQYIYRAELGGEKYLRRAIELDSNFISARIWLIAGLLQRNQNAEVEYHFKVLQKLEPKANSFEKAMIDWCQAFINHDLSNQAKSLEVALKYSPSNNILLANLAIVKYQLENYLGALEAFESPVKLAWHYPPLYLMTAMCYIALKRFDEAKEVLEDHLDVKPVLPESYAILSALQLKEGNQTEADDNLNLATSTFLQKKLSREEINLRLADVYLNVELFTHATEYYKKVLDTNPTLASVHEKLGIIYYNQKDKTGALNQFNEAIKIDSCNVNSHFMMAKIVDEMGENFHAIDFYTHFLKLDSLSTKSREAKSRIKQLTKITSGEK